jgi:hypothetical protein
LKICCPTYSPRKPTTTTRAQLTHVSFAAPLHSRTCVPCLACRALKERSHSHGSRLPKLTRRFSLDIHPIKLLQLLGLQHRRFSSIRHTNVSHHRCTHACHQRHTERGPADCRWNLIRAVQWRGAIRSGTNAAGTAHHLSVCFCQGGQTYVPPTPPGWSGLGARRHRGHQTNRSCSRERGSWADPTEHPADSLSASISLVSACGAPSLSRSSPGQQDPRRATQSSPSAWSWT